MESNQKSNFQNILFNIVIPVFILNKGKSLLGLAPQWALVIALLFPLCYGAWTFIQERKVNFIALLGLINVLGSGILTLLALEGIWFAVKEAFFPLLIGIFVFASSYTSNPFFKALFLNANALNINLINEKLDTESKKEDFKQLIIKSTQFLSLSFLLSAVLNFVLAIYIFTPIAAETSLEDKQDILNQQLSQMTMYSMVVILIPSMICMAAILYYAFKKLTSITGLTLEDLMTEPTAKTNT